MNEILILGYPTQPNPYGYPNTASNPPTQGYPNVAPLGFNSFDSQPMYPQTGYPSGPQTGYPGGGAQSGYPPQTGYPGSQPSYPGSQPSYPTQPSYQGYPPQQPPPPSSFPSSSNSWFDQVPQIPGQLPNHIQSNPNFQPGYGAGGGYPGATAPTNQGYNQPPMNQGYNQPTAPQSTNQGFNQPPVNQGFSQASSYTPSVRHNFLFRFFFVNLVKKFNLNQRQIQH